MKHLKTYRIFEAKRPVQDEAELPVKEYPEKTELKTIMWDIYARVVSPESIDKFIDLDDYSIEVFHQNKKPRWRSEEEEVNDCVTITMEDRDLEEVLNCEQGLLSYCDQVASYYSNYEWYFDESEYDYIERQIDDDNTEKLKKLAKIIDYELKLDKKGKIDDGEIYKLYNYIGLTHDLEEIKWDISVVKSRAIQVSAQNMIDKLPFHRTRAGSGEDEKELTFYYKDMIEYINEKKLKEIYTFKDLIETIGRLTHLDYDFEYDYAQFEGEYTDLNRHIDQNIDEYIDEPQNIFGYAAASGNLELVEFGREKELLDINEKVYVTTKKNNRKEWYYIFAIATGDVLEYFKSYDFQKQYIDSGDEKYNFDILKKCNVLNEKIADEYGFDEAEAMGFFNIKDK